MASYETTTQSSSSNTDQINLANSHFVTPKNSDGKSLVIKTRTESLEGILGVTNGGTGIDELEGGKLIASSINGKMFEEIDIPVSNFTGLKGNIQNQIDNAARSYVVKIPRSGFTLSADMYSQIIKVTGITETDNPLVGLVDNTGSKEELNAVKYAFSCISRVYTLNDNIVVQCYDEKPSIDITIQLSCV